MTSVELIEAVARATGIPKQEVAEVVRASFDVMTKALTNGEEVQFRQFGKLFPVIVKPRSYFGGKRRSGYKLSIKFQMSRRSKWRSSELPTKKKP